MIKMVSRDISVYYGIIEGFIRKLSISDIKGGSATLSKKEPKCYFCGKHCTEEDFCYGCQQYICEDCDETGIMGSHDPEDHRLESLS